MLYEVITDATKRWLLQPFQDALPETYPFKKIQLHDGSSLKLHPALAGIFPGRFTKTTPAAIELHLTLDLLAGTANYLAIDADKESERLYNPYADELKDTRITSYNVCYTKLLRNKRKFWPEITLRRLKNYCGQQ